MTIQSEQALENKLIDQLVSLEYKKISIKTEEDLLSNLKTQLEKHNKTKFSQTEFKRITNHLSKGNVFEKAKILRDKFILQKDDGTKSYIDFLDSTNWCQNLFQVTSQVTIEGKYKNRYDVTLLINGLPLVQIELKRRGIELKQAFHQINRYQRHSFQENSALFGYVQIFAISNGVNTKYYANNKKQPFKQTFFWADKNNKNITNLEKFTNIFLERCHISKMICRYIVLAENKKILMVLRPYQYYATELILDRIENSNKNAYIWHTTGSGKTLTSFKTSQLLMKLPKVYKVIFVVDRKDLDYQTTKEFNSFSDGSVDGTDNTKALVKQLGNDTKLIVTTIQKLNTTISKDKYLSTMESLKDKNIVFIFDECHRSQFGETHLKITKFFTKSQMIGFTGTPIFAENAIKNSIGKRTTAELFNDCLHKYVITDAISDENVLKFSIEYVGKYKYKSDSANNIDMAVENIDTKEALESDDRINKITDYIIQHHNKKTHAKEFNSIFAINNIATLTKYYELFRFKKEKKEHDLKIATIFSYSANEEDKSANGIYESDGAHIDETKIDLHSRDKLESYIHDYNQLFKTNYTTKDSQSYYNYYNDIAKRVKNREIDILLVVNMFLTGFDSPSLNTLYADKNLKHHGLIQAFSRTNRTLGETKSQGNIVSFRNLKKATDEAILLFSNKDAKEHILVQAYEEYVDLFNKAFSNLIQITPSASSVDTLKDENEQLEFIKAFREIMRSKNILSGFSDFNFSDLSMEKQQFEDYKSKYLDLYETVKQERENNKVSILEDVDFELELIHQDDINVAYILNLLANYNNISEKQQIEKRKEIFTIINSQIELRSKQDLIAKFIDENLINISKEEDINQEFNNFLDKEKTVELIQLCNSEKLDKIEVKNIIENYLYDQHEPLSGDIIKALKEKPKLLERQSIVPQILQKIMNHIQKFYNL